MTGDTMLSLKFLLYVKLYLGIFNGLKGVLYALCMVKGRTLICRYLLGTQNWLQLFQYGFENDVCSLELVEEVLFVCCVL